MQELIFTLAKEKIASLQSGKKLMILIHLHELAICLPTSLCLNHHIPAATSDAENRG
jgi:hypothetical protein